MAEAARDTAAAQESAAQTLARAFESMAQGQEDARLDAMDTGVGVALTAPPAAETSSGAVRRRNKWLLALMRAAERSVRPLDDRTGSVFGRDAWWPARVFVLLRQDAVALERFNAALATKCAAPFEEHIGALRQVFEAMKLAGITLNPGKAHLACAQLKFLGFIVSQEGVSADPDMISAIKEKAAPTCKKEAQRLVGMLNFLRPFVPGFARLAAPLYETVSISRWKHDTWTARHDAALAAVFEGLDERMQLAHATPHGRFHLFTDASAEATGAVLCQDR